MSNIPAQKARIQELKAENKVLAAQLKIDIEPHQNKIEFTKRALARAKGRLERLDTYSLRRERSEIDIDNAQMAYVEATIPIRDILDAIEENNIAIDTISSQMICDPDWWKPEGVELIEEEEDDDPKLKDGIKQLMDGIIREAIHKSFQYFLAKANGVIFLEDKFENNAEKRDLREAWEWISQDPDEEFYPVEKKYNNQTERKELVGSITFGYASSCLDGDYRRCRLAMMTLENADPQDIEDAMTRFRSSVARKAYDGPYKEAI